MDENNIDSAMPDAPVPFSNRLIGGGMIAFALLLVVLTAGTLTQLRDASDRNSAVATTILSVVLLSVGAVVGYRDFLPRKLVAATTLGMGLFGIAAGFGILAWVSYNLFIERQQEFRKGNIAFPFVIIAVGYGFVRKGISGLK